MTDSVHLSPRWGRGFYCLKLWVTCLLILGHAFTAAAQQQPSITLDLENAKLETVFEAIQEQAGYRFIYSDNVLDKAARVSVKIKNGTIGAVLSRCMAKQALTYVIQGKTILITPKKEEPPYPSPGLPSLPVADTVTVSGQVKAESGMPLPGATLAVAGTSIGTSTGTDGSFVLNVPPRSTITVSFIGYESKEVKVKNSAPGHLVISLERTETKLEAIDIVSTGYETLPRERATGSFAKVNNELFNRQVSTDVISRLKGVAPSLLLDERTGTTRLNIRGRSTIFANDQPLIILDNFPYEGDLSNINPNDVESIVILRDAAAASIWGVRAGNGVIVITSKRGKFNQKAQVDFNANVTVGNKPDVFYRPAMTTGDFIDMERYLFAQGRYDGELTDPARPAVSPVVEILDRQRKGEISGHEAEEMIHVLKKADVRKDIEQYLYRNSLSQQYTVSARGGGDKYSYYFSSGYDRNLLNAKENTFDRVTLNTLNTFKPLENLDVEINLVHTVSRTGTNNTLSELRMSPGKNLYPYARLADENGKPLSIVKDYSSSFVNDAVDMGYLDWRYTPIEELRNSDNNSKAKNTRVNSSIRYRFLKGFTAEFRYQYENQDYGYRQLQDVGTYYTRDLINSYTSVDNAALTRNIPYGGVLTTGNQTLTSNNGRLQVNYQKVWGKNEFNALGGVEIREIKSNGYGGKYYGYDSNTGAFSNVDYNEAFILYPRGLAALIPGPTSISSTTDRFRSYYLNAAYTRDGKYTISASARRDESNLFGVSANQKGVPLWSLGAAWDISKESFWQSPFDYLKIRGSLGYNGNFDNTVTAYTTARYSGNYYFTQQPYATLSTPPNNNLRWEKIRVANLGVDFSIKSGRLSGSLDVYSKEGKDLIGNGPLNATTGFSTFKGNIAASKGSGLDVQVNSVNINSPVTWSTSLLVSYSTDKVTSYELKPEISNIFLDGSAILSDGAIYSPVVGKPLFSIYSYRWAGLSNDKGDPLGYLEGTASADYSKLLQSPLDSLVYNGRATPPVFGALRNTVTFKSLSVSFNITYKMGYYFRRQSVSYSNLVNNYITHSDFAQRWEQPGDELHTDIPSFTYPTNSSRDIFYSRSEVLVERADHIRLQDVRVGYTLGKDRMPRFLFPGLEVYLYMNNLGLLWRANKHGIDPDYGNLLPSPKSFALGIKGTF